MVPVMSVRRVGVVLGMALSLLSACYAGSPDDAVPGLLPEERAIYQMLALELEGFRAKKYEAEDGICVGVHRTPNSPDMSAASPRLLQALEANVAGSPKLIPYSPDRCGTEVFGNAPTVPKIPWLLYASDVNDHPDWDAGFVCGGLCGWGHLYRVEIDGHDVSVRVIGDWIS
jgi:hypothetical protein